MPKTRMLPATRVARAERRSGALRVVRKPTYVARLLATLHSHYKESGMNRSYISDVDLLEKIQDQASEMGDELGKRFASSTQRALALLRRNHYVEYKPRRSTNIGDVLRITENMEIILDTVDEALDGYTSLSDFEMYRVKCEYLRTQIQPKSRKLPSCAELDKENRILEDDNRRLVQENRELEEEIAEMREDREEESSTQSQQPLQRQDTILIDEPQTRMTDSMYGEPALEPPTPQTQLAQPLIREPSGTQTPLRPPTFQHAAASYMTPESPPGVARSLRPPVTPPRGLARTDSHLFTPPATPEPPHLAARASRSLSPPTGGDAFDDNDDDDQPQDPSMDIDSAPIDLDLPDLEEGDDTTLVPSRSVTMQGSEPFFPTPENTPIRPQGRLVTSGAQTDAVEISVQPCVACTARLQEDGIYTSQGMQSDPPIEVPQVCAECADKDTTIAEQRMTITRLEIKIRGQEIVIKKGQENLLEVSMAQAELEFDNAGLRAQLDNLRSTMTSTVRNVASSIASAVGMSP